MKIIFLIALLSSTLASASEAPLETKALMSKLLAELTQLKPYFISDQKFTDPKNTEVISSHLKTFAQLAKQAGHDPVLKQQNFKFSQKVLEEHITDTEKIFRLGNKYFARWKLASTMNVCMSCHAQMPASSRTFSDFADFKSFTSDFDRAEFLFATRSFEKGVELYQKIIEGYPGNNLRDERIETSLVREVAYFSRIKQDPVMAIARLKFYQKNKALPESIQRNIAAWISQFEKWDANFIFDPSTATDAQVLAWTKTNLDAKWTSTMLKAGNPNLVTYLRVSGVLYQYLLHHPKSEATADILYWLAVCDRALNHTFFYSLADLYLKECIVQYPEKPIALKCYDEYEKEVTGGFSGSSGVDLPPDVVLQLKLLKEHVQSGGKVKRHDPK